MYVIEFVIEELFYSKEAANRQMCETSLYLGDELAERLLGVVLDMLYLLSKLFE